MADERKIVHEGPADGSKDGCRVIIDQVNTPRTVVVEDMQCGLDALSISDRLSRTSIKKNNTSDQDMLGVQLMDEDRSVDSKCSFLYVCCKHLCIGLRYSFAARPCSEETLFVKYLIVSIDSSTSNSGFGQSNICTVTLHDATCRRHSTRVQSELRR